MIQLKWLQEIPDLQESVVTPVLIRAAACSVNFFHVELSIRLVENWVHEKSFLWREIGEIFALAASRRPLWKAKQICGFEGSFGIFF